MNEWISGRLLWLQQKAGARTGCPHPSLLLPTKERRVWTRGEKVNRLQYVIRPPEVGLEVIPARLV